MLLASSSAPIFVISYFIQIPIAIYALTKIPMKGQLGDFYDRLRLRIMVLFGILPCAFFSVIMQLTALGIYMIKVKTIESSARKAEAKLGGGSAARPASGGNPFGGGSSPAPAPSGDNPFGGGAPSSPPPQGDNPFGGGSGGSATPPSDNPFA